MAGTSKVELFVVIINGWKPLTIIRKSSTLDFAALLDPPLRWCLQNCQNYYILLLIVIISELDLNLIFFEYRVTSLSYSPNLLKKSRNTDYRLGTGVLAEIQNFRSTRYLARNTQYFKFTVRKTQYLKLFGFEILCFSNEIQGFPVFQKCCFAFCFFIIPVFCLIFFDNCS